MTDKKKSTENDLLHCGVTEARIKQWKQKWGGAWLIRVPGVDGEPDSYGYFKKPSMEALSASAKFEDDDPLKAMIIIYEDAKLQVDPEIENEPDTKISAIKQLRKLVRIRDGEIKKL